MGCVALRMGEMGGGMIEAQCLADGARDEFAERGVGQVLGGLD